MDADSKAADGVGGAGTGALVYARLLFSGAALLVYVRLFFGVDFTDESFYVGLPYAFGLGHRPIEDELAVQQFSGIPLVPFVELYLRLADGRGGLVLFVRHLYFAGSLCAAWLVARFFGAHFGRAKGWLLAAVAIAFVPYGIPSVSYNTEANLGLVSGLILLASAARSRRPAASSFLGALLLLSVGFAYPTLTVVAIAASAASLLHQSRERPETRAASVLAVLAAAGLFSCPVAWLLWRYGSDEAYDAMYQHHTLLGIQGGGLEKVQFLVGQLFWVAWLLLALAIVTAIVVSVFRSRAFPVFAAIVMACAGPALWLASALYVPRRAPHATTAFALAAFAALGIALLATRWRKIGSPARIELALILAGALLGSFCIAWSSANGLRATGAGLLPAALVGLALLSTLRSRGPGSGTDAREAPPLRRFAVLMTSLVLFELFGLYAYVYRDASIADLDTKVRGGVFAGLRTTAPRARFIENFEQDLAAVAGSARSVLFFDYFPAGYLMSELVPHAPSIWMFPLEGFTGNPDIRALYARDLAARGPLPDLVVVMKAVRISPTTRLSTLQDDDVVVRLMLDQGYAPVLQRPEYVFYRRSS